jgi:hypothetical protein
MYEDQSIAKERLKYIYKKSFAIPDPVLHGAVVGLVEPHARRLLVLVDHLGTRVAHPLHTVDPLGEPRVKRSGLDLITTKHMSNHKVIKIIERVEKQRAK